MKRIINVLMILVLLLAFIPQATTNAESVTLLQQLPSGVGAVSSEVNSQILADDFILIEASSISQIEIWNQDAAPVQTYYSIHANTTVSEIDVPGQILANGVLTPSVTAEDATICDHYSCAYRHTLTLESTIDLGPGHYWLSVYGAPSSGFGWSYAYSNPDSPFFAVSFDNTANWLGDWTNALAFRLLGTQETCPTSVVVANTNDSDVGSLRQAIADVCPDGTIGFDSTLSGTQITLGSELILDKNLTIDGSELDSKVTISGNNAVRVFTIVSGNTVTLESLIITGGNNDNGGGIYNGGTLAINNSSLVNNTGAIGGGIINNGTLSITDSTFSQNIATNGGALTNNGTTTLTDCTISENQAQDGAGIDGSYGTLTVRDSTISGNTASIRGGGLIVAPGVLANVYGTTFVNNTAGEFGGGGIKNLGTTSVVNSTFTGNTTITTSTWGSAIDNSYSGSQMTLINSTLSGNSGGPSLYNANYATLNYANTIIANTLSDSDCYNYSGTVDTSINNLVESDYYMGCESSLNADPMLDPLADNGGPTLTMALQEGSDAIDAGDDTICAGTLVGGVDQREVARPQGSACDIGAFELEIPYLWQQLPGGESQQASYIGNQSVYDDFVLSQTETIREVEFWSSTPEPMTINVGFYTNSTDGSGNDIPGEYIFGGGASSIFTAVEDPAVCSQDYCAYRHSFRIELPLYSGHYWISIFGEAELYWSSAADMTGSFAYYPDGAVSPTLGTGNLAFRLLDYYTPKVNTITIEPSPSIVGMQVYTDLRFSDPDSSSHTGVIDWGDGTVDNADYCGYDYCYFPDHIYTTAGTYTVQAWVTDSEGHTGTLSAQHDVSYFMVPPSIDEWLASDTVTTIIELEAAALEGHIPVNFNIVSNPEQHGTFGLPTTAVCQFEEGMGAYICRASVEYTPPTETYNGYDNFSYTIDDGQGNFSTVATVPLWVGPNTSPTAQAATVQVSTILPTTIMLTATDPDFHDYAVDRLSISIGTGPTQGTLSEPKTGYCYHDYSVPGSEFEACNYQVTYTPNAEVTGLTDSFTFSVFDSHQYSMPGTVSLEFHAPVTWTVNVTEDIVDEFGCNESHCSLREAVAGAWSGDIIEFNLAPQATITLGGNDILIDKGLIINGPGADQLTISGGADLEDTEPWTHDRIFTVGGYDLIPVTVTINGLTIRDGRSDSGGGVIVLEGSNLTMNDCVIGPNNIVTYAGGGVFNDRAHLTMNRCTVTGNEGTGSLGGAGVTTAYSGATTTLINSTVSGNITNNFGGGLFVGPECVVSLINTTVSGNISNFNYSDPYEERGGGAGIYIESEDWSDNLVYLQNSIIAGNEDWTDPVTAGHEKWPDVYGEVTSLGGNLIGDPTGSMNTWDASDQVGSAEYPLDPLLAELAWNLPGTTQTMALLALSPAIDATPSCEVEIDQRGVTRPQGNACDIGAYELEQTTATGSLKITKVFDPLTSGFDGTFTIYYSCGGEYWAYNLFTAGSSQTFTGIPIGSQCSVSESTLPTPPAGWSFGTPSITPSGTVTIGETLTEVVVTNTIIQDVPQTGELKISKTFDPLTSTFSGDFTIDYDCDDGTAHDGTVNLAAAGSETISGIPLGTTCTVTESTLPTPPTGWSFGLPTFAPETGAVTITEASPAYAEVVVTNTISRDTGTLTITKYFDPLTSGFEGTFAINYDCDDGETHDGTVILAAGASDTITDIPTGTICTITEPTLPTPPAGWSFGTPEFNPLDGIVTVVIGTQGANAIMAPAEAWVTVTNTISRDLGDLKISKVFDPLTSGFIGDFTITYDCDDDPAHDGTVYLGAGESQTITGIPTGTSCTVSEASLPTPPTGWSFGTPTYNPVDGTVTISETIAEVTVTNNIVEDVAGTGELKITKVFDPLTSGFIGQFTISYDCDDGTEHDGTVSLAAGASEVITGIPIGTICTVSELSLPTAPEGWIFKAPVINPMSGTVTISEPSPAFAEVVVTNAIVDVRSQVTTTRTKCSTFAANIAPDLERLVVTTAYNKKTGETYIKKIAPSAFFYYVKALVPTEASVIIVANNPDPFGSPYLIPTTTLYDENCVPLAQTSATISTGPGYSVRIELPAGASERIIYVGVSYTTKTLAGYVVDTPFEGINYTFTAARDGALFTQDNLLVDYGTINLSIFK